MRRYIALFIFSFFVSQNLYSQLLIHDYKSRLRRERPRYTAQIDFNSVDNSYKGKERIEFIYPLSSNKGVVLRLFANSGCGEVVNMEILSVRVDKRPAEFKYLDNVTVVVEGDFRSKTFYTLEVEFRSSLPDISEEDSDIFIRALSQLVGSQESNTSEYNYGVFGCSKNVCNIASIVPSLAKVYDDDWSLSDVNGTGDYQRGDFADYRLDIIHSTEILFICNGITMSSEMQKDGRVKTRFVADAVNDIVCEASPDFNFIRREIDGVLYTSYYISDRDRGAADAALKIASDSVSFFSRYFAKYPYSELKIVQAPMTGGAGGVEFPALITVGSFLYGALLGRGPSEYGIYLSKDLINEMFEFVIVHEIAHQWFSTLVPSDSRKEPYLDEGLASFSAYLYFVHRYGEEKGRDILERQIRLNYVMMRLLGLEDMPVNTPIEEYQNMFHYAGIVYGKAPIFFIKLREAIGGDRFKSLLSSWTKERAFRDSNLKQFITMLKSSEPAKAAKIEALYERWINGRFGDEDIGRGNLKDLFKYIGGGRGIDLGIDLNRLRDWLEETFDMFREYR